MRLASGVVVFGSLGAKRRSFPFTMMQVWVSFRVRLEKRPTKPFSGPL